MVRIVELFEANPHPEVSLRPGEQQSLSTVHAADRDTLNDLHKLQRAEFNHSIETKTTKKWANDLKSMIPKSDEDRAADHARLNDTRKTISQQASKYAPELKNAAEFIKKYCTEFLPIMQAHGFLYRGFNVKYAQGPFFYGKSQNNRRPVDSYIDWQNAFDEMSLALGIKALRSNSVFATSRKEHAGQYGLAYIIIPCDDAHYAWSGEYDDIQLNDENMEMAEFFHNLADKDYEFDKSDLKEFKRAFMLVSDDGIEQALESGHEVWFTGHYVAVLASLETDLRRLLFTGEE